MKIILIITFLFYAELSISKENFVDKLWKENLNLYEKIKNMPFNKELSDGILEEDKFKYYIEQDYIYLKNYSKALITLSKKAKSNYETKFFLKEAESVIESEIKMHNHFIKNLSKLKQMPTTNHYISFLNSITNDEEYKISIVSILPCYLIYLKLGKEMLKIKEIESNKYYMWIRNYSSKNFEKSTNELIKIINKNAKNLSEFEKNRMSEIFKTSFRLEYLFWDAAYKKLNWID